MDIQPFTFRKEHYETRDIQPSQGRKKHVVSQRRAAGRTIDPTPRVIARKNAKDSPQRLPDDEEGNRNRYNHLDVHGTPGQVGRR